VRCIVIAGEAYRTACPMNLCIRDCFVANAPRNDGTMETNAPRNDGTVSLIGDVVIASEAYRTTCPMNLDFYIYIR